MPGNPTPLRPARARSFRLTSVLANPSAARGTGSTRALLAQTAALLACADPVAPRQGLFVPPAEALDPSHWPVSPGVAVSSLPPAQSASKPPPPTVAVADADAEARLDEATHNGQVDMSSYECILAPDWSWFTEEYVDAHPRECFAYPGPIDARSTDIIPKSRQSLDSFFDSTPLDAVLRRRANTLPMPVTAADGSALQDGKDYKPYFQAASKRIIKRGRARRIDRIILPPSAVFDSAQNYAVTAPATHRRLLAQIANIQRSASNFKKRASASGDSSTESWHTRDSGRAISSRPPDLIELGEFESDGDGVFDQPPDEIATLGCVSLLGCDDDARPDGSQGSFASVQLADPVTGILQPNSTLSCCIDEGSTGLPESTTGFLDVRAVIALGLKLDTSVRHRIATAGDGDANTHRAFGRVRARFLLEGHDLGLRWWIVTVLPSSTSMILGSQEKKSCGVDCIWSSLLAPDGPFLLLSKAGPPGQPHQERRLPVRARPRRCPIKASVPDFRDRVARLATLNPTLQFTAGLGDLDPPAPAATSTTSAASSTSAAPSPVPEEGAEETCRMLNHMQADLDAAGTSFTGPDGASYEVDWDVCSDGERWDREAADMHLRSDSGTLHTLESILEARFDPPTAGEPVEGTTELLFGKVKAIDELASLSVDEEDALLHNFKPDTLPTEYGIAPKQVAEMCSQCSLTTPLVKLWVDTFDRPGRCLRESEMSYDNLRGIEVEQKLRKGCEDVTWTHKSHYGDAMKPIVDEFIQKGLDRGFIKVATSSKYLSRILMVRKKDNPDGSPGGYRCCVDARQANSVIEPVTSRLPSVSAVINSLPTDAAYVSVCDFSAGFHSLRLKEGISQDLASFSTHRANYSFCVLQMGAQHAPSAYIAAVGAALNSYGICGGDLCQPDSMSDKGREMHRIFSSKTEAYGDWRYRDDELHDADMDRNFIVSYMDDTICFGKDARGALRRLMMLSYCATETRFWFNAKKCHVLRRAADFLGSTIACIDGRVRVYAQRSRVASLMSMPAPKRDRHQLLSAIQSAAWYSGHIPGFSAIIAPLHALSSSTTVAKDWAAVHDTAWHQMKEAISRASCRYIPCANAAKVIVSDASKAGLAGALYQINEISGFLEPLGYMSRCLVTKEERDLCPRELELGALVAVLHKFKDILLGQRAVIMCRTDHRALTTLEATDRTGIIDQRSATLINFLSKFRLSIVYAPGDSPILATADLLSRNLPTHASSVGEFGGGTEDRPWGTGPIDEMIGHTDIIPDMSTLTPDDTSRLRIKNADIEFDGPQLQPTNDFGIGTLAPFCPAAEVEAIREKNRLRAARARERRLAAGIAAATSTTTAASTSTTTAASAATSTTSATSTTPATARERRLAARVAADACTDAGGATDVIAASPDTSAGGAGDATLLFLSSPSEDAGSPVPFATGGAREDLAIFAVPHSPSPAYPGYEDIDWSHLGVPQLLLTGLSKDEATSRFNISVTPIDVDRPLAVLNTHTSMPEVPPGSCLRDPASWLPGPSPAEAPGAHAALLVMQPTALLDAQTNIKHSGFHLQMFDRLQGDADDDAIRATQNHLDSYRLAGGLLQRRSLGNAGNFVWQIVIPASNRPLQQQLIAHFHSVGGHPGGAATWRLMRDTYWWSGAMKSQCQLHSQSCDECLRWKASGHAPYGKPRVSRAVPIPYSQLAMDVMEMPATDDGYDAILVTVCPWSDHTTLIPMKSKGLIDPGTRKLYPQYKGTLDAWDSYKLAYKLYKRVFAPYGLPSQIRSDGAQNLIGGVWPELSKLLGTERVIGSAMSSDSNGRCERKIRHLRTIFGPIGERDGKANWKFSAISVQVCINAAISEGSELSPEQLLLSFRPRRLYDTIHDVSNLADSDVRRLIENRAEILNDMKLANYDARLEASSRLMSRQASRFRDLPAEWRDSSSPSFWVWLKTKSFSHAQLNRPGSRNKQLTAASDGPFRVAKIYHDGVNFEIVAPSWMSSRRNPKFNVKAIREVTDVEPPNSPPATSEAPADDNLWAISELTHRRYNKARDCYEYQCKWQGFARAEDEFRPESDIQADRLISDYDAAHPRGATRGDRPADVKAVLDAWPKSRSGRAVKRPLRLNQVHLIDSASSADRVADLLFFSQPEACHTFSRDADFAASLDPGSLLFCSRPSSMPAEALALTQSNRSVPFFREFRRPLRSVRWHPDMSSIPGGPPSRVGRYRPPPRRARHADQGSRPSSWWIAADGPPDSTPPVSVTFDAVRSRQVVRSARFIRQLALDAAPPLPDPVPALDVRPSTSPSSRTLSSSSTRDCPHRTPSARGARTSSRSTRFDAPIDIRRSA